MAQEIDLIKNSSYETKMTALIQAVNDITITSDIPIASTTTLGGIKVGNNLSIEADGTLNATASGTGSWSDISDKPFSTIGTSGLSVKNNVLDVDFSKTQQVTNNLTNKSTIINFDEIPIYDASSDTNKKITFANMVNSIGTTINPIFTYDYETGHLSYTGGIMGYEYNQSNGHLSWGIGV